MNEREFGGALRALRHELRLSQEDLAATLSTTQRHISFLETGRSAPTRSMLARIVTGLSLSTGQRATLFEASGFRNPYPQRDLEEADVQHVLDLLAMRVLRHWPFPGFVLDRDWNFLRANGPGEAMLALFEAPANMHALFLSPAFRALVVNWEQASGALYYRLQEAARRSPLVAETLERAVAEGYFDHIPRLFAGPDEVPVYIPVIVQLPDGPRLQLTSMLGRLVSVHDEVAEGFEVELLIPLDEGSEEPFRRLFGSSPP